MTLLTKPDRYLWSFVRNFLLVVHLRLISRASEPGTSIFNLIELTDGSRGGQEKLKVFVIIPLYQTVSHFKFLSPAALDCPRKTSISSYQRLVACLVYMDAFLTS